MGQTEPRREIRKLVPDDAPDYRHLRIEAAGDPAFGGANAVEAGYPIDLLRRVLETSDDAFILGAFVDADLVGMVGFGFNDVTSAGTLYGLYVKPEFRRQGLARRLLEQLMVLGRAGGARYVELYVDRHNAAARSLYRAYGFVEAATEEAAKQETRYVCHLD